MKISKFLKSSYHNLRLNYNKYMVSKASKMKKKRSIKNYELTNVQKKEIKNYYKKYHKVNLLSHYYYTEKTGNYHVNYIPDDLYFCYVDMYYNDWLLTSIIDNKCFYGRLLPNIKQPEVFAYRINNYWYDSNMKIVSLDELYKVLTNECDLFIKKASDSAGGDGVFYLNAKENDPRNTFNEIIKRIDADIIIQRGIKQHKVLSELNSSSVNTIRVFSMLKNDGSVKIYSSVLRMGINGSHTDNLSSGGISCGIKENGALKNVAFMSNGDKVLFHPTTGIHFETITVPKYDEIIEIVKKNHPQLPMSRLVSWDFAVTEKNEVVLVEVNLRYGGINIHQLNNGPLFGDATEKILDEVFSK